LELFCMQMTLTGRWLLGTDYQPTDNWPVPYQFSSAAKLFLVLFSWLGTFFYQTGSQYPYDMTKRTWVLWILWIPSDFFHAPPWLSGNGVAHINEVTLHRARLLLRWVTVSGFSSRCRIFISVSDHPTRSTQPGHPFVGRRNEYQSKSGDTLWLGSKGRYRSCVGGR